MNGSNKTSNKILGDWPQDGIERLKICPVCGSKKRSLLYSKLTDEVFFCAPGEWDFYRCNNCSSGYLDPRPTPETIGMAYFNYFTHQCDEVVGMSGFRRLLFSLANGYRNKRYGTCEKPSNALGYWLALLMPSQRAILDASMRHIQQSVPGERLLDVGCGSGKFLMRAKEAGWDVIGVDPDPKAVEAARTRGLDVRNGGIDAVSDMPESFDGITLSHVIEHVHDPITFLNQCYRLIKPGGWIWIETPNIDALGLKKYGSKWRGLEPPRHLVLFSHESLIRVLMDIGFVSLEDMPYRNLYTKIAAISEEIGVSRKPDNTKIPIMLRIKGVIPAFKELIKPKFREFITIRLRKPA